MILARSTSCCGLVPALMIWVSLRCRLMVIRTEGTADHRAALTHLHPELQEITIRWRGSFGYMDAWVGQGGDDDEKIPLCRIEYLGGDDWAFAIYDPAAEEYDDAILKTGSRFGTRTTPTAPPPSCTSPATNSNHKNPREPGRDQ